MPMATLHRRRRARRGHRRDRRPGPDGGPAGAAPTPGIDLDDVTDKLLRDGIDAFVTPMEKLLRRHRVQARGDRHLPPARRSSPSLPDELEPGDRARASSERRRGATSRGGSGARTRRCGARPGTPEVGQPARLADDRRRACARRRRRPRGVRRARSPPTGCTDVVLLGMGGSSLAPEVLRQSLRRAGGRACACTSSTRPTPARCATVEARDRPRARRCSSSPRSPAGRSRRSRCSSTSGRCRPRRARSSSRSPTRARALEALADEHGFRRVFRNDPDIGGRYSALSYFGLVPAALMGADVEALLDGAGAAEQACAAHDDLEANCGLWLGRRARRAGAARPRQADVRRRPADRRRFGLWVEQLVAESTGKQGKGILPWPTSRSASRRSTATTASSCTCATATRPTRATRAPSTRWPTAGQPVLTVAADGAGRPRARSSSSPSSRPRSRAGCWGSTRSTSPTCRRPRTTRSASWQLEGGGDRRPPDAGDDALRDVLAGAGPPRYVAIMGYVAADAGRSTPRSPSCAPRSATRTKATTTFGYGPRFLHSTGQFHKGGPPTGRFLAARRTTARDDVDDPGRAASPSRTLKHAQAIGDLRDAARPRPAGRAGDAATARPGGRARDLTAKIKEML